MHVIDSVLQRPVPLSSPSASEIAVEHYACALTPSVNSKPSEGKTRKPELPLLLNGEFSYFTSSSGPVSSHSVTYHLLVVVFYSLWSICTLEARGRLFGDSLAQLGRPADGTAPANP